MSFFISSWICSLRFVHWVLYEFSDFIKWLISFFMLLICLDICWVFKFSYFNRSFSFLKDVLVLLSFCISFLFLSNSFSCLQFVSNRSPRVSECLSSFFDSLINVAYNSLIWCLYSCSFLCQISVSLLPSNLLMASEISS